MTDFLLLVLVNIMGEMRRVPDHHVLVRDALSVDEAVDVGGSVRLRCPHLTRSGRYPIVDLPLVKPQDPHVSASEGVCYAVVRARDEIVSVAGLGVPDLPPSAEFGPSATPGFELEGMPVLWGGNGRGVELADLVVLGGADVEVEPPVDVVVVDVADARILYRRESKARADGSIIVKAPTAYVSIPTGLELAHQNRLLPLAVYGNAPKVSRVRPRFKYGLRGRLGPADSGGDVCPICLDPAFLKQPVAERSAGIPVILHVEDRGVGLEEHEFATVPYVLELNTGGVSPRGCGRSYHEETPERATIGLRNRNLELAGETPGSCGLVRIGQAAGSGGRQGCLGSPI